MSVPVLMVAGLERNLDSRVGSTTVTLALRKRLSDAGNSVSLAQITSSRGALDLFHQASGRSAYALDSWGMRFDTLLSNLNLASEDAQCLLLDSEAGLFDYVEGELGGAADFAGLFALPVILVADADHAGASLGIAIKGFVEARHDVQIVGIILTQIRCQDHLKKLQQSFDDSFATQIIGYLPYHPQNKFSETGSVSVEQYQEQTQSLEEWADHLDHNFELIKSPSKLLRLARYPNIEGLSGTALSLPAIGQHIAFVHTGPVSQSAANMLAGWRKQKASLEFINLQADEPIPPHCDAVFMSETNISSFLPMILSNRVFLKSLIKASDRDVPILAMEQAIALLAEECTDHLGRQFHFTGLLPLKVHLDLPPKGRPAAGSYLHLKARVKSPLGPKGLKWRAIDHGVARIVEPEQKDPLFAVTEVASYKKTFMAGIAYQNIFAVPFHLIDRHPDMRVVRQ